MECMQSGIIQGGPFNLSEPNIQGDVCETQALGTRLVEEIRGW